MITYRSVDSLVERAPAKSPSVPVSFKVVSVLPSPHTKTERTLHLTTPIIISFYIQTVHFQGEREKAPDILDTVQQLFFRVAADEDYQSSRRWKET